MDTTRLSLILRVRNRSDHSSWTEFDGIYRPMLQRFAMARGLDAAAAEEIAQDCMTAVNKYISGFDYDPKKGRFKGWLAAMVSNRIKNMLRDRREVQAATHVFEDVREAQPAPDELFEKIWKQEHLKHCLGLIKREVEETTFKAFVLYVMEEQPIGQVCQTLGMTENQVHVIKSRMLKRIRARMIDILGEEEAGSASA